MIASAIRELAASSNTDLIAAAYFDRTIQVWNSKTQEKLSEFQTLFCMGARNLALAPHGEMLVAGRSTTSGKVAAYEVPGGRKLWELKLTYPSKLRFSPSGDSILCTRNQQSVLRLDTQTGNVLETFKGSRQYIEGLNGDVLSIPAKEENPIRLIKTDSVLNLHKPSRWILGSSFSSHSVCLSEASGPVRCFSRADGSLQWTFDPGAKSHVVALHYSARLDAFFGVLGDFNSRPFRTLIRFEPTSGEHKRICDFDSWEEAFLKTTDQLVTSAGEIRNLSNGEVAERLAFPQKEYPDD